MWALETREIGAGAIRACLQENGAPATFDRLSNAWRSDASFRLQWVSLLRAIPFEAYAWENPPLTIATKSRAHECVFIDNPALLRMTADPQPFRDELKGKRGAISFPNLGRDALLVVPCPNGARVDYAHLAAFMRTASDGEAADFWQEVGNAMHGAIGSAPRWLSTAGLGVSWLHVRFDSRPKYYRHRPYCVDKEPS